MYPNKLTTSSMLHLPFFESHFSHEISCSMCHKYVLNKQNCRIGLCKNKNSSNVNIQKYVESKIIIQAQIQTSKLVQ